MKRTDFDTNISIDRFDYLQKLWNRYVLRNRLSTSKKCFLIYCRTRLKQGEKIDFLETEKPELRTMKGLSNSHFSRVKQRDLQRKLDFYKVQEINPINGVFGNALHECILENNFDLKDYCLSFRQKSNIQKMAKNFWFKIHELGLTNFISHRETVFETYYRGEKLKGGIDIIFQIFGGQIRADIKTTAAASQAEFELSIERYDYDRQAALYSADRRSFNQFYIFGISKQTFEIFVCRMKNENIKRGFMKLNFLIKKDQNQKRFFN